MLELLVVFGLASIGVFFTATTHEPEGAGNGRNARDGYGLDEEDGDEGGIGVLGIDVGRKGRKSRFRRAQAARAAARDGSASEAAAKALGVDTSAISELVSGDSLGDEVGEDLPESQDQTARTAATVDFNDTDRLEDDHAEDDLLDTWDQEDFAPDTGAPVDAVHGAPVHPRHPVVTHANTPRPARARPVGSKDDESFDETRNLLRAALIEDEAVTEAEEAAAAPAKRRPAPVATRKAPEPEMLDDDLDDLDDDEGPVAMPLSAEDGPPVIDDFDPNEDQIVIGYRPGEAGDGRIGISEDPHHPGTARVTLGGRVVAVVQNGYGKVHARHIELVQLGEAA
ncbi:hypothetical protein GLS40_10815 [Pseudooceanicola sp. 216_PA32_1]|uniref:Uncharacterized protein n=1 Tax=Pseudooceanicola pacificus TaxID=2676438 RepID=A0A844WC40_9RHOB|nr:hypothetical protein [Pseudooceanicola pacificus]MWB78518.1 hypothetical protein [Pseudooceanicola pacificus]